jgi:hypothetical protein
MLERIGAAVLKLATHGRRRANTRQPISFL